MIHLHGSKRKYFHEILGTNSRLDAIQAAVLRVKLRHLDDWAAGRQNRADRYRLLFKENILVRKLFVRPFQPGISITSITNLRSAPSLVTV